MESLSDQSRISVALIIPGGTLSKSWPNALSGLQLLQPHFSPLNNSHWCHDDSCHWSNHLFVHQQKCFGFEAKLGMAGVLHCFQDLLSMRWRAAVWVPCKCMGHQWSSCRSSHPVGCRHCVHNSHLRFIRNAHQLMCPIPMLSILITMINVGSYQ